MNIISSFMMNSMPFLSKNSNVYSHYTLFIFKAFSLIIMILSKTIVKVQIVISIKLF
jgi:hypothetical protein